MCLSITAESKSSYLSSVATMNGSHFEIEMQLPLHVDETESTPNFMDACFGCSLQCRVVYVTAYFWGSTLISGEQTPNALFLVAFDCVCHIFPVALSLLMTSILASVNSLRPH